MGLILEIVLTVVAWRKGWGWKALIPMGITGSIAFGSGFMIGLFGGDVMTIWPYFMILDVLCILSLIVMVAKPVGYEKVPSYKEIKEFGQQVNAKRAISSYGE